MWQCKTNYINGQLKICVEILVSVVVFKSSLLSTLANVNECVHRTGESVAPECLNLGSESEFPAQHGPLAFSPPGNSSPSPFMQFAASMAGQGTKDIPFNLHSLENIQWISIWFLLVFRWRLCCSRRNRWSQFARWSGTKPSIFCWG